MFENVLSNLLTKLVFHVEKPMNAVSSLDVETTDNILSQYQSKYSYCVSISESHRDMLQGVENIKKTDRQIYTVSRIVGMETLV
jgi:hypothetical protein